MGRGTPPGSAGVPPAYSAVAFRSVSLRCSTPPVYRRERRGFGCAETNAGQTHKLPGVARNVFAASNLTASASSLQGAPGWGSFRDAVTAANGGPSVFVFNKERQCLPRRARAMGRDAPPGSAYPLEEQKRWEGTPHPGARASRPHTPPLRSAQFPCDVAPLQSTGGNGVGRAVPRLTRASRPHNTRQSHTNFSHVNQPATTPFPNQRVKEVSDYLPSLPHPLP